MNRSQLPFREICLPGRFCTGVPLDTTAACPNLKAFQTPAESFDLIQGISACGGRSITFALLEDPKATNHGWPWKLGPRDLRLEALTALVAVDAPGDEEALPLKRPRPSCMCAGTCR